MPFATPTSSLLVREPVRPARSPNPLSSAVAAIFGVRGLTTEKIVTALGVAAFVDIIILTVEAATIWSVSGLMHLPATMTLVLGLAIFLPAKWLCWKVAQMALRAEAEERAD